MANDKVVKDSKGQNATSSEDDKQDQGSGWKYSSEVLSDSGASKKNNTIEDIHWSASEFIAHEKNVTWYVILVLVTLVAGAIVYFLTHDKISTVIIVIAGVIFGIYGARKPRLIDYRINSSGITVQTKLFSYDAFKSFEIVEDSIIPNIVLMPLKRFMPSLSIYLDPTTQEEVVKILSDCLPQDFHQQDLIERFVQRVRF
jgi:hypothetical protein